MNLKELHQCSKICNRWHKDFKNINMFEEADFWLSASELFKQGKIQACNDEYFFEQMASEINDKAHMTTTFINQIALSKKHKKALRDIKKEATYFRNILISAQKNESIGG